MRRPRTFVVVGAAVLLAASSQTMAGSPACGTSCAERIHAPAPRIIVEQSPPEVVFRQAPCAAPCREEAEPAPVRCGLFRRHRHHAPAQTLYIQAPQPAPVMAAPMVLQPAPVMAAPIALQPAPVMAAPVMAAPVQQVVAAPVQQVVAAPVQQMVAAPVTYQPVAAAPLTAPCGPARLTQEGDLDTAALCLQRARSILAGQSASLSDAATELRGIRTRLDKMQELLMAHDAWIEKQKTGK